MNAARGLCPICRHMVFGATHEGSFIPSRGEGHALDCDYGVRADARSTPPAPVPPHIERLLRVIPDGTRVRAVLDIFYAVSGLDVPEGTLGVVRGLRGTGLVFVLWDIDPEPRLTAADAVDPVDGAS